MADTERSFNAYRAITNDIVNRGGIVGLLCAREVMGGFFCERLRACDDPQAESINSLDRSTDKPDDRVNLRNELPFLVNLFSRFYRRTTK